MAAPKPIRPLTQDELKTHCIHGHKYTPENTMHRTGGRRCRACSVADCRARRAARKGQVAA